MNPWPDRHSAISNCLKRIAELKNENIKLQLRIYQLGKDSQSVKSEQIDECLATFTPLLECSERILTCGQNCPVKTHLKNFEYLLEQMPTTLIINRPMPQGKGTFASKWRSPVVQKRNAGPLNASTPSPLLGASESVGLRGLEEDIEELALWLDTKLVLSSPVLEEREEENRTLCSAAPTLVSELCVESNIPVPPVRAASPAPPVGVPEEAGGLNGLSPRKDRKTGICCFSTPVFQKTNAGPLNASTPSPLLGASESVGLRGLEEDIEELALWLETKLVLSSPVLEEREEENRTLCSAAPPAAPEAGVRELAVRTEDKPRQRCSLTETPRASSTSSTSTSALKGSGRATRNCGWDVKDLTAQINLTSVRSGFSIDLGAGSSATAKQANTGATTSSTICTLVSELCGESNIPVPPVRAASPAPPVGVPEEAGGLNGLSPRKDRKTGICCFSTPVFQKTNAGLLNTSTPSPLLGASESVGLRSLEEDIEELALWLETKLVLSSPVLEEREEENRTLCSAAPPAAPEAGVRELAVRTEDKPRQRCSLTETSRASSTSSTSSSTSTSALKGSGRATRNCGWDVKDLTARLQLTSVSAGFTIILDAGPSPTTKPQAEAKAAMTSALPAIPEGVPAQAGGVSTLLSPSGAPELEDKPEKGRTSIPRKNAKTARSSSSSPALRGAGRATQTSAWDVKDLQVNFNLPSLSSSFTLDLGADPSAMDGLKAARF